MARTKKTHREDFYLNSNTSQTKKRNASTCNATRRSLRLRLLCLKKQKEALEQGDEHEFESVVDFNELLQNASFDFSLLHAQQTDTATADDMLPVTVIKAGDIVSYSITDKNGTRTRQECGFVVACIPHEDSVSFLYFDVHESRVIRTSDLIIVLFISMNKKTHYPLVKWIRVNR